MALPLSALLNKGVKGMQTVGISDWTMCSKTQLSLPYVYLMCIPETKPWGPGSAQARLEKKRETNEWINE